MVPVMFLMITISLFIVDVTCDLTCVCNKDPGTQIMVFDSNNASIGLLSPHQCKLIVKTSATDQNWIAIQFNDQTGYVVNNADFILIAECPGTFISSQTTSVPLVSTVAPPHVTHTSGCHLHRIPPALHGNVTLCPHAVVHEANSHCNLLTQHGHSCYEMNRHGVSWTHAAQICSEKGGHLLTIQNVQENTYIHQLLHRLNYTHRVWIGLQDRTKEGQYHWVTGEKLSYTNWSYHATHDAGNKRQDCAVITPSGQWEDVLCGGDGPTNELTMHRYSYICEYRIHGHGATIIG